MEPVPSTLPAAFTTSASVEGGRMPRGRATSNCVVSASLSPCRYLGAWPPHHQLGGWGRRINIVPQATSFNRGNWAQLENAVARCMTLAPGRLEYRVQVRYRNSVTLVPSMLEAQLTDTASGQTFSAAFANVDRGGALGTQLRRAAEDWLRALGCQ